MNFINNKKTLVVSLSLVVGLCGVNVLGAIAQSYNVVLTSQQRTFNHKKFVRGTVEQYIDKVPNFLQRTDYFYKYVDLNNDGIKEIVIVVFSPVCGAWECSGYILQKDESAYKMIGKIGVQSSGGEIVAIQKSMTNGFADITTLIYDSSTRTSSWKLYEFDGNTYRNTYQNSRPSRVILNVKRGSGLKL